MKVSQFMARQYANPSGVFGRLVTGYLLNRANTLSNQAVFESLDIAENSTALEIGFGGGKLLLKILRKIDSGKVTGLEISPSMLQAIRNKTRKFDNRDMLELQQGKVENLPFANDQFDRVCSVNTVYFWPDLMASFSEINRVTCEDGIVVIGLGSKSNLQQAGYADQGYHLYTVDEVQQAMKANHLKQIDLIEIKRQKRGNFYVLKCQKTGNQATF